MRQAFQRRPGKGPAVLFWAAATAICTLCCAICAVLCFGRVPLRHAALWAGAACALAGLGGALALAGLMGALFDDDPKRALEGAARQVACGRLRLLPPPTLAGGCEALAQAAQTLQTLVGDMSGCLSRLAQGDWAAAPQADYPGDFGPLRQGAERLAESLRQAGAQRRRALEGALQELRQARDLARALCQGSAKASAAAQMLAARAQGAQAGAGRLAADAQRVAALAKEVSAGAAGSAAALGRLAGQLQALQALDAGVLPGRAPHPVPGQGGDVGDGPLSYYIVEDEP